MADALPPTAQETEGMVSLAEVCLGTVWNVRGDRAHAAFAGEALRSLGMPLPSPGTSARNATGAMLWLGPRAWLLIADSIRDDYDDARRRLNAAGGALFDVSASYAGWSVAGDAAPRVLNKACPLDLDPHAFHPGDCAQSVLGHVNALFCRPAAASRIVVMVARSFAADAWSELIESAACDGYRIDPAAPFIAA